MEEQINPLKAELNPICHLLALLGAHNIFHGSGLRVNSWPVYYQVWRDNLLAKKTCSYGCRGEI